MAKCSMTVLIWSLPQVASSGQQATPSDPQALMQGEIPDEIQHPGNSVTGWRPQKAGALSSPWGNKIIEELMVCELILLGPLHT